MHKTYYRVCVTDGWHTDSYGQYLRDAIKYDCGHNHQTPSAADKCQDRLIAYNPKTRSCSAKWYNSNVLPVDKNGKHLPEKSYA